MREIDTSSIMFKPIHTFLKGLNIPSTIHRYVAYVQSYNVGNISDLTLTFLI